jgi:hypothetical protein
MLKVLLSRDDFPHRAGYEDGEDSLASITEHLVVQLYKDYNNLEDRIRYATQTGRDGKQGELKNEMTLARLLDQKRRVQRYTLLLSSSQRAIGTF